MQKPNRAESARSAPPEPEHVVSPAGTEGAGAGADGGDLRTSSALVIVDDVQDAPRMTLGEHIDELRSRLMRVVLAVALCFAFCFLFYSQLWQWVMLPRIWAAEMIGGDPDKLFPLQGFGPLSGLTMVAGLAVKCAIALSLPIIFIELWLFVVPGLRRSEKRALSLVLSFGSLLFLSGIAVAFRFAAPIGIRFLSSFNRTLPGLIDQWMIDDYMSFVTMICFGFGACFELPLVLAALTWAGLVTPVGLRKYWRHIIMVIIVIGAAFTPPDPFTMLILSGCLLALFAIGYGLSVFIYNRRHASDSEGEDDDLEPEDAAPEPVHGIDGHGDNDPTDTVDAAAESDAEEAKSASQQS